MRHKKGKVLMLASVASMIDQFNIPNIRLIQKMGYEVHVACNFREGNTCDAKRLHRLRKILAEMSVRGHQWDCPREAAEIRRCCKAYRQLLELTGKYDFDWMHCHSPVGGVLARLVAHWRGMRVIYTAHGFHFYYGAPLRNWLFYYPVEKLLAYWTDVLITVNKEDYWFARKHLKAKQVWYSPGVGIDTKSFFDSQAAMTREEFCRKYQLPTHAKILLSVGELSRRKNHRLIISSLPKLQNSVYYLICGQGKLYEELSGLAQKKGVAERVRLLGYVEDLREIYRHADFFVFPSLQEGLPVALVEAMACGLPCLVSDIRGNRELVRCKSGRFRPDCEKSFLKRFTAMLYQPGLMELNCRQMQKQVVEYDIRAVERRLLLIYKGMES